MVTVRVQNEPFGKRVNTISRKPFWIKGMIAVRYKRKIYRLAGGIRCNFFITTSLPI